MGRVPHLRSQEGFSLIELMAAALVLVVGMLGTLTLVSGANKRIVENRAREAATNLAREVAEGARAVPYPDVTPASIAEYIMLQPGLADSSSAAGWQVERRDMLFTITVDSCIMDETSDGIGDHTATVGTFCANSPSGATTPADLNPDDYKRVSIDVTRVGSPNPAVVKQTAVVNNPGSAFAPSVRSLTASGYTTPYRVISTPTAGQTMTFNALVTPRAAYVPWTVDNVTQGNASGPSIDNWTFQWPIGPTVPDGVYLIGAKGFNAQDQTGSSKSVSVTLNRYPPKAPVTFAAGRNGAFGTEFEWSGSTDRDVTGYRVYRMLGASPATSDELVCATSATDANPLTCVASTPSGDHRYYVVAVAPTCCGGIGQQESTPRPTSGQTVLVTSNIEPNPPENLTGARVNGVVTLTWDAPIAPEGGEAGDSVAFYRIYRDGLAIANRFGRADPDEFNFVDAEPTVVTHQYWVTAVDSHLRESTPVGGMAL